MQKSTSKSISSYTSVFLLANTRASTSICINAGLAVLLQIDVQSGSIPVECLSREVDYRKRTSPCHTPRLDTPVSPAFPAL